LQLQEINKLQEEKQNLSSEVSQFTIDKIRLEKDYEKVKSHAMTIEQRYEVCHQRVSDINLLSYLI
jgi:FtsZ-binding cell division protein ZapB